MKILGDNYILFDTHSIINLVYRIISTIIITNITTIITTKMKFLIIIILSYNIINTFYPLM